MLQFFTRDIENKLKCRNLSDKRKQIAYLVQKKQLEWK